MRPLNAKRGFRSASRLVSAFQQPPEELEADGKLRSDLFYRLEQGERIVLVPLAEHLEDLPALAACLLGREAARRKQPAPHLAEPTQRQLLRYDWPGNVRQLDTVLLKAYRRARWEAGQDGFVDRIEVRHLADVLPGLAPSGRGRRVDVDPGELLDALRVVNGDVGRAAGALALNERTLRRRIEEFGIDLAALRALPTQ